MTNYISQINKARLASVVSKIDIISLYNRTGKDNPKFFPILNYAAMRLLSACEEELETAALEWIGENVNHFIIPVAPELANGFAITKRECIEHDNGGVIFLGESYHIGVATTSQRRDLFYTMRSEASNPAKTMLAWICPLVVKSLLSSISDSFEGAIKDRRSEIESFPNERHVMRLMKEYRHSGGSVFNRLPKIADRKGRSRKRYVTFPVIARENGFEKEDKYICRYDREYKECMLFNGKRIMRIPDLIDVYAVEPDGSMALEILRGYIDGVRRMKRAVDDAERQRNTLLALI